MSHKFHEAAVHTTWIYHYRFQPPLTAVYPSLEAIPAAVHPTNLVIDSSMRHFSGEYT